MSENTTKPGLLSRTIRVSFNYKLPFIWFGVALILCGFAGWWSHKSGNQLQITISLLNMIVVASALWVNAVSFYYNYTATKTKNDFDEAIHLNKKESSQRETERIEAFNAMLEKGLTKNSELLELRIQNHTTILEKRLQFDKKICSINLITEWHREFHSQSGITRKFMDNLLSNEGGSESLPLKVEGNPTVKDALIPILNYFEKISLSIKTDVADETILKDFFKDIFIRYYENLHPYFVYRRQGAQGSPNAFVELCVISKKWGAKPQD